MQADPLDDEARARVEAAFDPAFYLARNPDIADAGADPFAHFLADGWREGRDPSRRFSVSGYLELNPDVAASGANPLIHYVLFGEAEGRASRVDLGFRYDLLKNASPLAEQLETNRGADLPGGSAGELMAALGALGADLFISFSHDAVFDVIGGVQLCIRRESAAVRAQGRSHLHLYPAISWWVTDFESLDPVMGVVIDGEQRGLFRAADIAQALAARGAEGRISSVEFAVHSLLGHSVFAVLAVLDGAGARAGYFWLHDQSSLCASYALLRNDVAFCGAPPPDSPACSICIYGLRRIAQIADIDAVFRRHEMTVISPSQAQLDLWQSASQYRCGRAVVHPHAALSPAAEAPAGEAGPLKVAFLGFPAPHKGWPVFEALAGRLAADPRYAFVHLGKQGDDPPPIPFVAVATVDEGGSPMIEAVAAQAVDVALILSICPETFCFTAHEAAAGGAAVIAFPDSGAVARFASDPAVGRVVADESALAALFDSGEIMALGRRARGARIHHMRYSRLTADFLPPLEGAGR